MKKEVSTFEMGCTERYHEVFYDEWHTQIKTLAESKDTSRAARLAISLGLDDATVKRNHSGESNIVKAALNRFVLDVTPAGYALAASLAGEDMERPCDPFILQALRTRGINAIALMHFERVMAPETMLHEFTFFDGDGLRNFMHIVPETGARRGVEYDYASLEFAHATWFDGTILHLPLDSIPDTIQSICEGHPVGSIISHPLMDPGLIIHKINDEGTMIEITLRRDAPVCTWREAMSRSQP